MANLLSLMKEDERVHTLEENEFIVKLLQRKKVTTQIGLGLLKRILKQEFIKC